VRLIDEVTRDVIGLAKRIHRELGPGLFETVYETVLAGSLQDLGYRVDRQLPVDITFEGRSFPAAFRTDLLIDDQLIVEVKSVDQQHPAYAKQLLTYLRLMKLPVGLVINFGGASLKEGIRRVVNGHLDAEPSAPSASLREPTIGA
jgi:GxxExxY protein